MPWRWGRPGRGAVALAASPCPPARVIFSSVYLGAAPAAALGCGVEQALGLPLGVHGLVRAGGWPARIRTGWRGDQ